MNADHEPISPDMARVLDAVSSLGEHFDSVQIFVTRHESGEKGGTLHISRGAGNWFARIGHVRTYVNQMDQVDREKARRDWESDGERS